MYKCDDCGSIFDDPQIVKTTFEAYYGVSDLFDDYTPLQLTQCPACQSQNVVLLDKESEIRDVIDLNISNFLFDDSLCLEEYVWKNEMLIPSEMIDRG